MIYIGLLVNLLLIAIAIFIKKYPGALAGYNTMSEQEKSNVEIDKVANVLMRSMLISALGSMLLITIFTLLDFALFALLSLILPILLGIMIALVMVQKYDHNKSSKLRKNLPVILLVFITLFITIKISEDAKPTKLILNDNEIEFTGSYGVTVDKKQIQNVELCDELPRIRRKTRGLGLGNIRKGYFEVDELGKCLLFLNLPNPPYLYIELLDGEKIIFNSENAQYTDSVYNKLTR